MCSFHRRKGSRGCLNCLKIKGSPNHSSGQLGVYRMEADDFVFFGSHRATETERRL